MPQGKIGIEDLGQEFKSKINKVIEISEEVENGNFTYVHPNNSLIRHVTDLEKSTWNNKANDTVVTSSDNGLMKSTDKVKLDGIAVGANKYIHPDTHPASMISIADTSNLFTATDVEGALKEVFTAANNGKNTIVNAIIGVGGSASNTMTFTQLAEIIKTVCSNDSLNVQTGSIIAQKYKSEDEQIYRYKVDLPSVTYENFCIYSIEDALGINFKVRGELKLASTCHYNTTTNYGKSDFITSNIMVAKAQDGDSSSKACQYTIITG